MASRPDVRGGSPTRGFPPGSAQALVALVLGLVLFATGLQRDQLVLAGVFLGIALLGGVALVRLLLRRAAPPQAVAEPSPAAEDDLDSNG